MAKLIFENIGRGKWNGAVEIPDNSTADSICSIVNKTVKKHLASKYPDIEYDAEVNVGYLYAGVYLVGKFHKED